MLYSADLQTFDGTIPNKIQEAIEVLCRHYKITHPLIYKVDDSRIAVPAVVHVSVPPLGTIGGVDIREEEPILIRFNINSFPETPPIVVSDRKDFPRHQLSHLYASPEDDPPARLCLVRGDLGEWFSRNRMENLLEVTDQWFFKAATGQLNEDGNEFDPLRLDKFEGYHVYRYNQFKKIIEDKTSFFPGQPFACFITMGNIEKKDDKINLIFKTEIPLQAATIHIILKEIRKLPKNIGGDHPNTEFLTVLIWDSDGATDNNYTATFPKDYRALKAYFQNHSIDLNLILNELILKDYITRKNILVTHAIKRPKKVIGFDGPYEFVNFKIFADTDKRGINPGSKVTILNHIEPFSGELALKVAGENMTTKNLFIGAGSLGSKIALHFGRSGNSYMGVCDNDPLLQHNLTRHSLFAGHVGRNKAVALVDELQEMYEFTPQKDLKSYPGKVFHLPDEIFAQYEYLIDTTASIGVRNWLVEKSFSNSTQIARCEIADQGKLGLLYIEGRNRNPRVDDLANLAVYRALKYPAIEKWRKADVERGERTLDIGLGCSSITSVMADDILSLHAALFSKTLYSQKDRTDIGDHGLFLFQSINDQRIPDPYTKHEIVPPFDVYLCQQGSGWEIRFFNGLREYLLTQTRKYKPLETGGVLIGVCNYKTKTIHVFGVLDAPPQSKRTHTSFVRSNIGLPRQIDEIKERTGSIIGYVGEWHSHPMPLETLSTVDLKAVNRLLPINRRQPIPTLTLIITKTDLIPFVFL